MLQFYDSTLPATFTKLSTESDLDKLTFSGRLDGETFLHKGPTH